MNKRILITGKDSYIGGSVLAWLKEFSQPVTVDELCLKGDEWQQTDFSNYDAIFHVAGIAHSDMGKADDDTEKLYQSINTDLAVTVATKAKRDGVPHFVFMSSMIVFGDSAPVGQQKRIGKDDAPNPANFYGDSKLQAELGITKLQDEDFRVAIIRPPMVYGKNVKGNYPRLVQIAQKMPLFPLVENERSMIHIDNLCEFIRLILTDQADGTFHPQNAEYVRTSDLVAKIAAVHGRKIHLVKFLNPLLRLLAKISGSVNKVFGNLSYDISLSEYPTDYRVRNFEESVELTER